MCFCKIECHIKIYNKKTYQNKICFAPFLTFSCLCCTFVSQLWHCLQLPLLLQSIFFPPVKYGCVWDDCSDVETSAMILFPDKKKEEGGLSSRSECRFLKRLDRPSWASGLSSLKHKKHVTAVSAWVRSNYRGTEMNQKIKGKRHRGRKNIKYKKKNPKVKLVHKIKSSS